MNMPQLSIFLVQIGNWLCGADTECLKLRKNRNPPPDLETRFGII